MISQPGHMYILGQKKCGNSLRSLLEDFATVFVALYKCFNISYFFGQSSLTIYYILLCIECFLLSICQPSVISRDWDLPCKPSFHLRIINYINTNVTIKVQEKVQIQVCSIFEVLCEIQMEGPGVTLQSNRPSHHNPAKNFSKLKTLGIYPLYQLSLEFINQLELWANFGPNILLEHLEQEGPKNLS